MKKLHYAVLAIIAAVAFIAYASSLPPPKCSFQNCHGLDIVCGEQPIQCELVYQYGDNCRRFAHCKYEGSILGGSCTADIEPRFYECRTCVLKCLQDFPDDYLKSAECEYKCTL